METRLCKLSIQRQMVVTHTFYFMLCKSSLFSTVISFVYKDKLWFDESMSVIFCMENIWKRILLFPLHIELNLKTLLCNWRGSPWRPGRMKSIIQKGIIQARTQSQPKTTNFKPVDHMMYEGQVRSKHLLFVQFSPWAFKLSCYSRKLL